MQGLELFGLTIMITKVDIKNFQCHKTLCIEFDKNVTSIIGLSDTGKSAILRAIRWVLLNLPSGTSFLKHKEKEVSVTLTIDGIEVERSFDGVTNLYRLGDRAYKAFGREIPEPIKAFLKTNSINFQGQHDAPFWFSNTAGEVSRELNRIVDLEVIDKALSRIASTLRTSRIVLQEREENLKEAKRKRRETSYAFELKRDYKLLQEFNSRRVKTREKALGLSSLVQRVSEDGERLESLSKAFQNASSIAEKGRKIVETEERLFVLKELIHTLETYESLSKKTPPPFKYIDTTADQYRSIKESIHKLTQIVEEADSLLLRVRESKNKWKEVSRSLKNIAKGRCPLCGKLF